MGRLKHSSLDEAEWGSTPGITVCAAMFDDTAIQAVINKNLTSRKCSYSGKLSRKLIAAPLDKVVECISNGIRRHYDDANNGVGWDHEWDEGVRTLDTYDLIEEAVAFSDNAPRNLFEDIVEALPARDWSKIDPYGTSYGDVMKWSWDEFCDTIKHVRRYFFEEHIGSSDRPGEKVSPRELLQSMADKARSYGLFRDLPTGQVYYRSRYREGRARIIDPLKLGPPPPNLAKQSRMSPAGITMFYGAQDTETSLAETIRQPGRYALARFHTTRPMKILDLTKAPWVSIFDDRLGALREWCRFMARFIQDFQKPVVHDGSEHYEYTPTQVVTEFLRVEASRHGGLDGILYRSVQRRAGVCVVLFAEQQDVEPASAGTEAATGGQLLRLERVWNRELKKAA